MITALHIQGYAFWICSGSLRTSSLSTYLGRAGKAAFITQASE